MKVYLVQSVNEEILPHGVLNLRVFAEEKDAERYAKSIEKKIKPKDRHVNFLLIEEFDVYMGSKNESND
jgi:hypothetical protein